MKNNLFITGLPRTGKTSLLRQCLSQTRLQAGGFAVQRLTENGRTWAFRLLDLSREPWIGQQESVDCFPDIAITLKPDGHWQGHPEVFDTKGVTALEHAHSAGCPLLVMDELGIFERDAFHFQRAVIKALDNQQPVLGVLKPKPAPFLDRVRGHPQVQIVNLTAAASEQGQKDVENFLETVR